MTKTFTVLLVCLILLTACTSEPNIYATSTPLPISTSQPLPTVTPTAIPPTPPPQLIELNKGRFSLSVRDELDFDIDDSSINLSDHEGRLVISLNGRTYIASEYTLESFLGKYLAEMASRGGTFNQSEPYEIVIDGVTGVAIDFTGTFLGDPIAGKAISISPDDNFIVFGLAMSNLGADERGWTENGSIIFEALLGSIRFKKL